MVPRNNNIWSVNYGSPVIVGYRSQFVLILIIITVDPGITSLRPDLPPCFRFCNFYLHPIALAARPSTHGSAFARAFCVPRGCYHAFEAYTHASSLYQQPPCDLVESSSVNAFDRNPVSSRHRAFQGLRSRF